MTKKMNEIWEHIIEYNKVDLRKNLSIITSEQIKKSKLTWRGGSCQFEPRLICKMDSSCSRPKVFVDNDICVLSIQNGVYLLIKENIYVPLVRRNCSPKPIPKTCNSLILNMGNSETTMLSNLYFNKILNDIIGEEILYGPLLGGRHRCTFDTIIGNTPIKIQGSQYETDGCYETQNFVCIVEAKSSMCNDFNIRQLYYPYREVYAHIGNKKQIICLFIYKDTKKIIHIHKFKWNDYKQMLQIDNIGYYQYYD